MRIVIIRTNLKRFLKTKLAIIGFLIVFLVIVVAIFASLLAPYDPYEINADDRLIGPGAKHPFGTDQYGRDILSRIVYGSRISLQVGISSCLTALILGTLIGAFAGYFGGIVDIILMRIIDTIWSVPWVLLTIVLVALLGPSLTNMMIAIGIAYTPAFSRIVRSLVLEAKENLYVKAARAIGKSNLKILFIEILPNCFQGIIVFATVVFADAVIMEAGLSFIGLGVQPPAASWGVMVKEGTLFMKTSPYLVIFPALAISFAAVGFNLLGDGLRDYFDPRLRRQ